MTLTEEQKRQVIQWIDAGAKLSEIQTRLEKEFGARVTYMEVRFLVDDLKVLPKDPTPAPTPAPTIKPATPAAGTPSPSPLPPAATPPPAPIPLEVEPPPTAGGRVTVTVDTVVRPGAMISGNVTFSDGKSAGWYLDQMGRLGLSAKEKGYRPSAADIEEFQMALQDELARKGF